MLNIFKKKSLAVLLASFVTLVNDLRELADERVAAAKRKDAEARKLMAEADEASAEAEEALNAADKIEELVGGSAVLSACVEQL